MVREGPGGREEEVRLADAGPVSNPFLCLVFYPPRFPEPFSAPGPEHPQTDRLER